MPDGQYTVLITDREYFSESYVQERWAEVLRRARVVRASSNKIETIIEEAQQAQVMMVRRPWLDSDFFQRCAHLVGVAKWGVGVERIDTEAATAHRVIVANSPGNYPAMGEATLLLMLALSKDFARWTDAARTGKDYGSDVAGIELEGKMLGVVGWGRIGRKVTTLCQGLGMTVQAYDPYVSPDAMRARDVRPVALDELLSTSDVVSLHPVLTRETYHMIGDRELRLMKPTAFLVNTSRGPVIDEAALYRVLEERAIRAAGLDVFEAEPLDPNNPLLSLPNVIATPHALGRTVESGDRTAAMLQEDVLALLDHKVPPYIVNPLVKPKWEG